MYATALLLGHTFFISWITLPTDLKKIGFQKKKKKKKDSNNLCINAKVTYWYTILGNNNYNINLKFRNW